MNLKSFLSTASQVLSAVAPLAELVPGGAAVESVAKLAINVAAGLEAAEPAAEAVWSEIQAAKNGAAPPTAEQWVDWNARADQVHAAIQAM